VLRFRCLKGLTLDEVVKDYWTVPGCCISLVEIRGHTSSPQFVAIVSMRSGSSEHVSSPADTVRAPRWSYRASMKPRESKTETLGRECLMPDVNQGASKCWRGYRCGIFTVLRAARRERHRSIRASPPWPSGQHSRHLPVCVGV